MGIAVAVSKRATCTRLQVGAILVKDDQIWSTGYNGVPSKEPHCEHDVDDMSHCAATVHAEENALDRSLLGMTGTMYITHAPCVNCAHYMIRCCVERVVYGESYGTALGIRLLESTDTEVVKLGAKV